MIDKDSQRKQPLEDFKQRTSFSAGERTAVPMTGFQCSSEGRGCKVGVGTKYVLLLVLVIFIIGLDLSF